MSGQALRRGRFRGLLEGLVQRLRADVTDIDARDDVERHQDYGYAANPVEGEGLRLEVGGHTIVLRMDRTAERPRLAAYEVSVWHKEGHSVTLRAGRVVEVDCDDFIVNASNRVLLNTPEVQGPGDATFAGTVTGDTDVVFAGKSSNEHRHGNVKNGTDTSGGPV